MERLFLARVRAIAFDDEAIDRIFERGETRFEKIQLMVEEEAIPDLGHLPTL